MSQPSIVDENWTSLLNILPDNWEQLARDSGALVRPLRSFPSTESVLRTLLIHIAQGFSLRETVTRAKQAQIADVSDVALLKRLRLSETWLKQLCQLLFSELHPAQTPDNHGIHMRAVDGSVISEPGPTGSQWLLHYSLRLPELQCDQFTLTPRKGVGTGESLKQFQVSKNDCIIADRAYSTNTGIAYIDSQAAYSLVRVNTSALVLSTPSGNGLFNLQKRIESLQQPGEMGQWSVSVLDKSTGHRVSGRICAIKKSQHAADKAIKKIKKEASKRQRKPKAETLLFAQYIIVFTTLPETIFSLKAVLDWYRLRWQIELIFKRLKSLAGLGHLPKYDPESSRAWLYGKLLVGLLTEKLIRCASAFSPWGYY